ncbi:MAG: protein ImuB [Sphingomonadales bacterium]|nr:protein ImuB [Sphingomonadales bacterium]
MPNLSTDRIRRRERRPEDPPRHGEEKEGDRIAARNSHWRPGARWAREIGQSRPAKRGGAAAGAPLVTVHKIGNRVEIDAACPAARALGFRPGMALATARALFAALDVREADPEGDRAFLARLALFAARRWTPRAAVSGADGLWLDLDGVAHLFGGERRMCERIRLFCARLGLASRIAVAGTAGAASALARYGADPVALCPAGGEAEAVASLPLTALRLDAEALANARRLGIERIGELPAMPRGPLRRRFGEDFLLRLDQALGRAAEPFDPIVPEETPAATLRFAEPIATAEAIGETLALLTARLVDRLAKRSLGVRRLVLLCQRIDGAILRETIGTARPTRDADHLTRLMAARIEKIEPGFGLEAMRLVAERVEPLAPRQLSGEPPAADLAPLVDRLAGRLGPRRLFRMSALESDLPERSVHRVGPLAQPKPWPAWPRPVRLLSPPEPVENVIAALPDHPPLRFLWRGRMHRVRRADGPERLYGEWWRDGKEAEAVRDYFQVEDEEGGRFWLFRRGDGEDPRTGDFSWHLQGVFG